LEQVCVSSPTWSFGPELPSFLLFLKVFLPSGFFFDPFLPCFFPSPGCYSLPPDPFDNPQFFPLNLLLVSELFFFLLLQFLTFPLSFFLTTHVPQGQALSCFPQVLSSPSLPAYGSAFMSLFFSQQLLLPEFRTPSYLSFFLCFVLVFLVSFSCSRLTPPLFFPPRFPNQFQSLLEFRA